MADKLIDILKEHLRGAQGREVNLKDLRSELRIDPASSAWNGIRVEMLRLTEQRIVKPTGRKDGSYKVITPVIPVRVFSDNRERREPFELIFPKNFDTMMEMDFAERVVVREGDVITVGGISNYGKTALAMNFCGENIETCPVLMGNEYTSKVENEYEPTPRFLNRLDAMDWVEWTDSDGADKFTLLPVREDYAEHIVKDRINIIDWINLSADRLYDISKVMADIKSELGRGVAIVVLQKGENANAARGGQFTKDFTDCELLIDKFSESESMLTVGKVKEYTKPVIGKTYAFGILQGVKIINFREIVKCPKCRGNGYIQGKSCEECSGRKFIDKG